MAIFSKIIIASGLAALVAARPLAVAQRDVATVTETAWSTVDVVETLWVDSNGTPVSTGAPGVFAQQAPATTTTATVPTTPAAVAAQAQSYSAPSWSTPTAAPSSPMTTTPATPAWTPSSSSTAAAPTARASGAGGSTGSIASGSSAASCTGEGDACQGDITHWDGGLGACGWNVDTSSDMQIALPFAFMGTQSNGNPYCGKSLTIQNPNTGATVQATVGDKCMGCTGRSIDLTDALFNAVGGGCDGRCSGFNWWFN